MRKFLFIAVFGVYGAEYALSQSLAPFKDLAFAQVAMGGQYETVISVTNRGSGTYSGTLYFLKRRAEPWNTIVNGTRISNGSLIVRILAGQTSTFRVTGDQGVETGFAIFAASDLAQNNFLEGNLTYFVRSGSRLIDSAGIAPSTEFYLSTIPFEDFSTLGLALANINDGETNVTLSLYSSDNVRLDSKTIAFGSFEHQAKYLFEFFPTISLGRGRLEIQCDRPVVGTAITDVQGQFSSLPLLPSPTEYSLVATASDGTVSRGEVTLWAEGLYVKGVLRITDFAGSAIEPEISWVYGRLILGTLRLSFYQRGKASLDQEVIVYVNLPSFSFTSTSVSGSYVLTVIDSTASTKGTFSVRRRS